MLYAWAKNAPSLSLPEQVGFEIGENTETGISFLVLQLHFGDPNHMPGYPTLGYGLANDSIGLTLEVTKEKPEKLAGVYLLSTRGKISNHPFKTYLETACVIKERKTIYPFAFRTPSKSLGEKSFWQKF